MFIWTAFWAVKIVITFKATSDHPNN